MIRRQLISSKAYIHPNDPAVDHYRWDPEKADAYFRTDFSLPPLKKDAEGPPDFSDIKGDPDTIAEKRAAAIAEWESQRDLDPTIWKVGQLTGRQVYELTELQQQYGTPGDDVHPILIKFVIEYGLKGWIGLETEDADGNIEEFKPDFVKTPLGRKLSDPCYYELLTFFADGLEIWIAGVIHLNSRAK